MRRIEDLTHEELLALTSEDIQRYVDLEIAYDGIKMINPPVIQPLNEVNVLATEVYYEVNGTLYKTEEDAAKVAAVSCYREKYDWNIGYNYKYVEGKEETSITTKRFFKKPDLDVVRKRLIENNEIKTQNEKVQSEYEKFLKATESCRATVMEKVTNAHSEEREILNAVKAFETYLALANQDKDIALAFYEKAYKDEQPRIKDAALIRLGIKEATNV